MPDPQRPAPSAAPPAGAPWDYKGVLQQLVQRGGSDLHLKVGRPPTIRVNGELEQLVLPHSRVEDLRSVAEQIMSANHIRDFKEQKEADFALAVPGLGRFRVNAFQQRGTIVFVFRAIPFKIPPLPSLNLPPVVEQIAMQPRGLIRATGITGS